MSRFPAERLLPTTYRLHFQTRTLQDALAEASAGYWRRRAETLLQCVSRPGDFNGRATAEQIAARDQRLREDAARCMRHAGIVATGEHLLPDIVNVLAEVV